jgi:uncharacterized protein with HEPN domain
VSRNALLFLEDIEKSCTKIVLYTEGLTRDQVFADELRFDGILFNLHVIGEAVKRLPMELRNKYPEVAWREIAGLRDFVAHAYFALDLEILWDAIQQGIPTLKLQIAKILTDQTGPPGLGS